MLFGPDQFQPQPSIQDISTNANAMLTHPHFASIVSEWPEYQPHTYTYTHSVSTVYKWHQRVPFPSALLFVQLKISAEARVKGLSRAICAVQRP